jgi:hypothetical protein
MTLAVAVVDEGLDLALRLITGCRNLPFLVGTILKEQKIASRALLLSSGSSIAEA